MRLVQKSCNLLVKDLKLNIQLMLDDYFEWTNFLRRSMPCELNSFESVTRHHSSLSVYQSKAIIVNKHDIDNMVPYNNGETEIVDLEVKMTENVQLSGDGKCKGSNQDAAPDISGNERNNTSANCKPTVSHETFEQNGHADCNSGVQTHSRKDVKVELSADLATSKSCTRSVLKDTKLVLAEINEISGLSLSDSTAILDSKVNCDDVCSDNYALDVDDCSDIPSSPATIDVTELTPKTHTGKLQRPLSFSEDFCDVRTSDLNQMSTKIGYNERVDHLSPSSLTSANSSPVKSSGTSPIIYKKTPPQNFNEDDDRKVSCIPPNNISPNKDAILVRSRTSTSTSQGTENSSSVSIGQEDLSEGLDDGEEGDFVDVNLSAHHQGAMDGSGTNYAVGVKPKKKGLSGFISKNIFKKSSSKVNSIQGSLDHKTEELPQSWKLFGKGSDRETFEDASHIAKDYQQKGRTHPPTSSASWKRRQSGMKLASSTTALILEDRPSHLPQKPEEERDKHKQEYEEMVRGAKKKELKVFKKKLKDLAEQLRHEDEVKSSLQTWTNEILPNWDSAKSNKKTRDLWWQGVPPSVRGRVWMLAIGNELNITEELFEIFLVRAKDRIKAISDADSEDAEEIHEASREASVDVIKLDVARTFPQLCIFQKGGPYYDLLHGVLGAYACYRPDVGYVQGMSFIAAVLLLYLEMSDAFICFANLLNKSCQLAFFRLDEPVMQSYYATYEEYFQLNMPRLYDHFQDQQVTPDLYIIDWMYTLYSKSLPLDMACRVWDNFFRDGEEFLFRVALGILNLYADILMNLDFIQIAQYLTKLPENIPPDKLFQAVEEIDMHNQKRFREVLAGHMAKVLTTPS